MPPIRSPRSGGAGKALIEELQLQNIKLRRANILEIDDSWGQFDYIIAHGVFSWVPREVQEKVLQISSLNLAPNGVAFVSWDATEGAPPQQTPLPEDLPESERR